MKVFITMILFVSSTVYGADQLEFKRGVKFDHHAHQTVKVGVCSVCHEQTPGKIAHFGKSWAHKNCVECHDLYQEGPTKCGGCHKI